MRYILARNDETPLFGYSYYYTVPSDCTRILWVSDTGLPEDEYLTGRGEPGR